ncbi:MAG: hypothetical protein Q7R95_07030 [bacterium]|nr:hypothetical protein [bacterium]
MKNLDSSPTVIHNLENDNAKTRISYKKFFILLTIILVVGTLSGFVISKLKNSSKTSSTQTGTEKIVGIVDKNTYKDKAEGILKEGGIDGEGSFHLERPGGLSQNVYLTSSTVDLSVFIGKKVRVWGATQNAQKAGWLMDVGSIEKL